MTINIEKQAGLFIKVFCNIINNPKIAKLDHQAFRFYIYLHILAKNYGSNGTIKSTLDEICWELRWQKPDVETSMNVLIASGFISKMPGMYIINDWSTSQYTVDYKRVKKFRMQKSSKHDNGNGNAGCNGVSNGGCNGDDNGGDNANVTTEKEKEKELDLEGEAEVEPENPRRIIQITKPDINIEMDTGEEFFVKEEEYDGAEVEEEYNRHFAGYQNQFEESDKETSSTLEINRQANHIYRLFRATFPLCLWTPENCIDVIQNNILASKLWTEKEISNGIKELAKKFPRKNATPRDLIAILQQLSEIGATERASAQRRKKWEIIKAEEERILRENEEWRKIHGKREPGQAVREILELIAQREKEEKEKKAQEEKNKS